jgi:hypothetical protein
MDDAGFLPDDAKRRPSFCVGSEEDGVDEVADCNARINALQNWVCGEREMSTEPFVRSVVSYYVRRTVYKRYMRFSISSVLINEIYMLTYLQKCVHDIYYI